MYTVKLEDLYRMDYGVTGVVLHRQHWRTGDQWFTPEGGRINTAISLPLCCRIRYYAPSGEKIAEAVPGDVVLLPQGSRYFCRFSMLATRSTDKINAEALFFGVQLRDGLGRPFTLENSITVLHPKDSDAFTEALVALGTLSSGQSLVPATINQAVLRFLTERSMEQSAAGHKVFYQVLQALQQSPMPVNVPALAASCGMSESTFRRGCKLLTGMSPLAYLRQIRMEQARRLLENGELRVRDVAQECGFNDEFYFSRVFRQETGCAPSTYRAKKRKLSP